LPGTEENCDVSCRQYSSLLILWCW